MSKLDFVYAQTKSSLDKIFYKVVYHHINYICDFFDEFRRLFCHGLHEFSRKLWFAPDTFLVIILKTCARGREFLFKFWSQYQHTVAATMVYPISSSFYFLLDEALGWFYTNCHHSFLSVLRAACWDGTSWTGEEIFCY